VKEVVHPLPCRRRCRSNLRRAPDHQDSRVPAAKIRGSGRQMRTMRPAAREVIEVKKVVHRLTYQRRCRSILRVRGKVVRFTKRRRTFAPTAKNHESEEQTTTMLEVIEIEATNHYHAPEDTLRAMAKLFGVKDRERAGHRRSRAPAAKSHRAGRQPRTMCLAVKGVIEVKEVVDHLPYRRRCRSKLGSRLLWTRGKVVQVTKRKAPAPVAKNHEPEEWTTLEVIEIKKHNHGQEDNRFLQTIVMVVRVKETGRASNRHRR